MAQEVEVKINVETKQAIANIEKLTNTFEDTTAEIKDIKTSAKNAEAGVKSLSDGFKGMGLAIKAIGIGLVMDAFNLFKEILGKNQKVVDLFNTAIGTLSIAFNDLIGFVMNNFPSVIKIFKDVFENPTTYLKKFGDLIKENLIERFNSFLDTVGYLGSALKKVFEGDFAGAMDSVKQAGKESIDVLTGVNNTVDRGAKAIGDAANAISDYAVKTFKASEANVKLQNSALLAAAEQSRLVEQYDREAEVLRQTRDDVRLTVEERIKANDELKKVLDKQEVAMKSQANMQVAAAEATKKLNNTIENQVALVEALSNAEGILAQVTGLRSEQRVNEASLSKELIDLSKTRNDTETELAINERNFNAERIKNESLLLQAKKEALAKNEIDELKRLENAIKNTKTGTQAKVDAEKEYLLKKQEFNQQGILIDDQIEELKRKKSVEKQQLILDNDLLNFETKRNALIEQERLLLEDSKLSEEERNKIKLQYSKSRVEIDKAEQEAKLKMLDVVANGLNLASQELGESTEAGKIAAVAAASISTYTAIAGQLAAFSGVPVPGFAIAQAILTGATGLLQVKKILSVKTPKGGAGGGSAPSITGGGISAPPPASFNVVGASGTNQLAQTIAGQQQQPIQAYVVAGAVTTAQSLNRNIISSASMG